MAAAEVRSPPRHDTNSGEVRGELNNGIWQCPTGAAEPVLAAVSDGAKGLCERGPLAQSPPFPPCRLELEVAVLNCCAAAWHFSGRLRSAPVVCALTRMDRGNLG